MPAIPKNVEQSFAIELRDTFGVLDTATTGAPTVNLCKDGTWAVATNAATNTKAGYWTVTLTAAETNYREVIVEAVKTGFVTFSRTFYPEPDFTPTKATYLDEAVSAAKTLTTGERTSIAAAVWNALTSGLTTVGSIGKKLADWVVGTIDTYTGNTPQTGDSFARLGAPAGASVSADVALVQSGTNDLQTRVPAALVSGRMDASVGAMASNVLTAAATHSDFGTEIANAVKALTADGLTWNQILGVVLAASACKLSGCDTNAPKFRDYADTLNRISATTSTDGRLTITLNLTGL